MVHSFFSTCVAGVFGATQKANARYLSIRVSRGRGLSSVVGILFYFSFNVMSTSTVTYWSKLYSAECSKSKTKKGIFVTPNVIELFSGKACQQTQLT